MTPVDWARRHKVVAVLIGLAVSVVLLWFVLVGYIDPQNATHRKDVVQVFALIVAGVVGVIGAAVGVSNLRIAQRNLEHNQEALDVQLNNQRELGDKRAQDGALQAYFEQMGYLLTDHSLRTTDRKDIKLLARAQTLTVAGRLDQVRKRRLLVFLYGAGLISKHKTIVSMSGTDFSGADLSDADLIQVDLSGANLRGPTLVVLILKIPTLVTLILVVLKSLKKG